MKPVILPKRLKFCCELTYLADVNYEYVLNIDFNIEKIQNFLGEKYIHYVYKDSGQILEIVTKFLTPASLLNVYSYITKKLGKINFLPSTEKDIENDGGCHYNVSVPLGLGERIFYFLLTYPSFFWYWNSPNDNENQICVGDGSMKKTNMNIRDIDECLKTEEIEFRSFYMPRNKKEMSNQLLFLTKLINYCSEFAVSVPPNIDIYHLDISVKKPIKLQKIKNNFLELCKLIGYNNKLDWKNLTTRFNYGPKYLV